ncbi:uncharacterized protein TRIVIDRAFT_217271 [Trichoderma virens Gv29-8]|uniref:Uncharacterized protein n=1 Tax=Hypocrea virens (strain Gv29-8 / FGSC 10586) TaxID=413071 RepID=G9NCY5_HYPVG|nr:uncharacterized protein TRIVIDRAFT_217271 [Trichoderma virens Gv29-8]EHK15555.1 hypothetical protein TRIVIDRAFT_217271 [Trichoderma virens Gv29-8]
MASAGRLTFLYPQLLRAATRGCGPARGWATTASTTTATTTRWNSSFAKRRGKAVEPTEWEKQQQQQQQQQQQDRQDQQEQDVPTKTALDDAVADQTEAAADTLADVQAKSDIGKLYFQDGEKKAAQAVTDAPETDAAALRSQQQELKAAQNQAEQKLSSEPTDVGADTVPSGAPKQVDSSDASGSRSGSAEAKTGKPKDGTKMSDKLDTVYYMGAPENMSPHTPSMTPPKYIHHFDSYSLVKQLQEGGYSSEQAVTMMKAIRTILAHNLDMAQEKLVSKSDIENVRQPSIPILFVGASEGDGTCAPH